MSSLDRYVSPVPQEFLTTAENGVAPLSGGELRFSTTGTSNLKDTYSDAARTTVNANPLPANSDGRWPDIFLGEGDYRVTLSDADGTIIETYDPVAGGFDPDIASALASTTASAFRLNIGGRSDIDAAVDYDLRTAADATARTTAMNNAAAAGADERRKVYLSTANPYTGSNSWTFDGRIALDTETVIEGDHRHLTLMDFQGAGGFYCPNADTGNQTTEVSLKNLHIRGNDHTGSTDNIGIEARITRVMQIENCLVERFTDGIVFDGAQFAGGESGNTFARLDKVLIGQNHAANGANTYPQHGIRFFSSTGINQTQDASLESVRAYSEISIAGPETSTSGTTHALTGFGRFLFKADSIRVFREDANGGTYTQLTHVASSPGAEEYTLTDDSAVAIAPGDDIRGTMANDILAVVATTGVAASVSRNIRIYWIDPKGFRGLSIEGSSGISGDVVMSGYEQNVNMDGPANSILLRYHQVCHTGVRFGPNSQDSRVYLGEQSGASVLEKVDISEAAGLRVQYKEGSNDFAEDKISATFTSASLTPAAIPVAGGDFVSYQITEHPGPREVVAELDVAVVGAASSFGLFTLEVSYDGGTVWTPLAEKRVDVGYRGDLRLRAVDTLMENTDAQVSATFKYRVTGASSSTSTTIYAFGTPTATTLGASETTGATLITVAARDNFFNGEPLRVTQDDGTIHYSLIASGGNAIAHPFSAVTGAGDLTIATGIASDAASGLAVSGAIRTGFVGVRDVNPA